MTRWAVPVAAAVAGLAIWWATMASAPRYSFGADEDSGSGWLFPLLLGAAVVAGALNVDRADIAGMAVGLPGAVLSPFTAPRGDNDGLWILIIPMMVAAVFALGAAASVAAGLRTWLVRSVKDSPD